MAVLDHRFDPNSSAARRVEVFMATGRRRRWSFDEKARIVEETLVAGGGEERVSQTALISRAADKSHGSTSGQSSRAEGGRASGVAPILTTSRFSNGRRARVR